MRGMLTLNLSFLGQSIAIARPTIAHSATADRCTAGFSTPPCPLWVIRNGVRRGLLPLDVRFAPRADKLHTVLAGRFRAISGRGQQKASASTVIENSSARIEAPCPRGIGRQRLLATSL